MSARNFFSENEKTCLMQLISKYKLQKRFSLTSSSQSAKKVLWQCLTEEFNANESNSTRTEAQLKKCWDNLKTRQKNILREGKEPLMKTCEGHYKSYEPLPAASRETPVADASDDQTDTEIESVFVSDTIYDSEEPSVASRLIKQELTIRQQAYEKKEKREEELFRIKKKEREFLMMAAEESFYTAKAEREAAVELVCCNRAKRELAEYELKIKMKKQ